MEEGFVSVPRSEELEHAFLFALVSNFGIDVSRVRRLVLPEDLFFEEHRQAYKIIGNLYDEYGKVDIPLLMARDVNIDFVSGADSQPEHILFYASEILDLAQRRRLITHAGETTRNSYALSGKEALDETEKRLAVIAERAGRAEDGSIAAALREMQEEEIAAREQMEHGGLLGYHTGIPCYDDWSDGLRKGHYHVIGGYTGTGKTRVAILMTINAIKDGAKVLFVTLEMPKSAIAARMVSYLSGINTKLLSKPLVKEDQEMKEDAVNKLSKMPIFILEQNRSITLIDAAIDEYKPNVVFIDYAQKIEGKGNSIYEIVTSNTGRLQTLAIRHHCCVVALSQVSNASASGMIGDEIIGFKESGALAADADCAIMLKRDKMRSPNVITLELKKNRHGIEGKESYFMDMGTGRIRALSTAERR